MVTGRVIAVRHKVADHAILHSLLVVGVEVLQNDRAHGLDGAPSILGQFGEIFFNGGGLALHGNTAEKGRRNAEATPKNTPRRGEAASARGLWAIFVERN